MKRGWFLPFLFVPLIGCGVLNQFQSDSHDVLQHLSRRLELENKELERQEIRKIEPHLNIFLGGSAFTYGLEVHISAQNKGKTPINSLHMIVDVYLKGRKADETYHIEKKPLTRELLPGALFGRYTLPIDAAKEEITFIHIKFPFVVGEIRCEVGYFGTIEENVIMFGPDHNSRKDDCGRE